MSETVQPHVWKLTNGKFVHPECREAYQAKRAKGGNRPGIFSAVHPGYEMNKFTLCDHCQVPIWATAKGGAR